MKILCIICHDQLILSEEVFFTRCGHVFHHQCLLQWLERCPTKTCPQCRAKVTEDRIHRVHFTFTNTEDNECNSLLEGRIENLKFQILLNERNINYYISKNATLEKQNAGLRREVRKVESEITQKNSAIHALKEQIKYFKEKSQEDYVELRQELFQKRKELACFQLMHENLSKDTLEDVQRMVGNTTDRNALINCISILKEKIIKKKRKINDLRGELTVHHDSLTEERSKSLEFEERLAFCESENLSLRHKVNELEKLLKITDQNCVTNSSSRRNSNENLTDVQTIDIYTQETADQSGLSSPEVEIIMDANQENSMHNSTFECSTVTKKAKLCLQSGNSSDITADEITRNAVIASYARRNRKNKFKT